MTNYDDLIGDECDGYNYEEDACTTEEASTTEASSTTNKRSKGSHNFINPKLVGILDNCKVSTRYATHLLVGVAESLGHDVSRLAINRESIRLCRQKYREEMAHQIKDEFHAIVN